MRPDNYCWHLSHFSFERSNLVNGFLSARFGGIRPARVMAKNEDVGGEEWDFLIPFQERYKPKLGEGNADSLLKACCGWVTSQSNIGREGLNQILGDNDFRTILAVHEQMKAEGSPNLVADYILELSSFTGLELLMVPYVYFSGTVPRRFLRTRIGFLGSGSILPKMMEELGLRESCLPEKVEKVGSLEASRSDGAQLLFVCRYCKRSSESYTLSSMKGQFHEVGCPRYLPAEEEK